MRELLAVLGRLAESRSPVLLYGETGTGKELLVHWLHHAGSRRNAPLVEVHCPSIPAELVESELFGHEKGAFTDAGAQKAGKLELAEGGTVYLDQVEDLPLAQQAKLLRVVEERRFERLGGLRTLQVDVRFVASATSDLRLAVRAGTFREDLFHRLGVLPLLVPPLRARREDVLPLCAHFLARERERGATAAPGFDEDAERALVGHAWPGNVRELKSLVERVALGRPGTRIGLAELPLELLFQPATLWEGQAARPSLREVEMGYIRHVLAAEGGSQTRAAQVLGISRKALWEKRRRYKMA
jgi:DNA-binding NtrC family response regulator